MIAFCRFGNLNRNGSFYFENQPDFFAFYLLKKVKIECIIIQNSNIAQVASFFMKNRFVSKKTLFERAKNQEAGS